MTGKRFCWLVGSLCCLVFLVIGCEPAGKPKIKPKVEQEKEVLKAAAGSEAVSLALKFSAKDSTVYKLKSRREMSLKFEGALKKDSTFKDGYNDDQLEMTFIQEIQEVDDKGNAIAKITIQNVKYLSVYKNNPVLDFDSTRQSDSTSALALLIQYKYIIKISPSGDVRQVISRGKGLGPFDDKTLASKVARELIKPEEIRSRHSISAFLPGVDKKLRTGESWSRGKVFSFPILGLTSYERVYTLKDISKADGSKFANVEMEAIPSAKISEELKKEQQLGVFSDMFDNKESYAGQLKFNLSSGKIQKYTEKLQSEWTIVDPVPPEDNEQPSILKMSTTRFYSLEQVD